ncbi:unnamed protein product [Cuscuta europaea]|uniref:Uncharacterized protein n=1 Tax=Cuscuta europaea TaxID=41803 RepID=A0A9P0YW27_CUSEU|nr:unnamed protein product [Cuscuta europaea]
MAAPANRKVGGLQFIHREPGLQMNQIFMVNLKLFQCFFLSFSSFFLIRLHPAHLPVNINRNGVSIREESWFVWSCEDSVLSTDSSVRCSSPWFVRSGED